MLPVLRAPCWLTACALACGLVGCSSMEPRLAMSDGQRTYMDHCTSCHAPYEPHEYPPDTWRKAVSEMEKEHDVRLSEEEKSLILGYVTGGAARAIAQPATRESSAQGPRTPDHS